MSVNPPEPENFANTVTETVETQTTVEHPNTVYLGDVQAAQLAIYQANVEKRKPDFTNISDAAVRAAGYNPKTRKPLSDTHVPDESGHATGLEEDYLNSNLAEQTPIINESGQVNKQDIVAMPGEGQLKAEAEQNEQASEAAKKAAEPVKKTASKPTESKEVASKKAAVRPASNVVAKKSSVSKRAQKAAAARKSAK